MTEEELAQREHDAELRQRAQQARLELPQTRAAFDRVRQSAMRNLFETKANETEKREMLYRLVHLLNVVEDELLSVSGIGNEAIDAYIASLSTQPATTGNP